MTPTQKPEPKNIEASVRARLHHRAEETGRPFAEVFQYYGMERFLYRLSQSKYADVFVLKGALMFLVWEIPGMRVIYYLYLKDHRIYMIYPYKKSEQEDLTAEQLRGLALYVKGGVL
jgi:hypothetical protein